VLAVVGDDWVHDGQESFNKACDDVWIRLTALCNDIALLDAEHVIKEDNNLLVLHLSEVLLCLVESYIDLVDHEFVPQMVLGRIILAEVKGRFRNVSLDPLLEDE